ncbi:uncharacterized protein LOC123513263 [Portunus trituberculatus]|uniref:uncharacterized protein LOC123513263 n=1 Tax=Portunus trituberculatus TaxID=210409 RepID=UPI001E1D034F|nr:uncharacterized protein LOC123513263 [Portunus trituberculatus]
MEADVDMRDSISPGKRGQPDTPPDDIPERSRCCTAQDHPQAPDEYVKASFLLRGTLGGRLFANPAKVSRVLHDSAFGKYIIEGETRSLGNGSSLIVAVWAYTLPKVPMLQSPSFTLGEWPVTCRRADRESGTYHYAKVGPLADDTTLEEVRDGFRVLEGNEVVELTWLPPHSLPRFATGKWLRLKMRGSPPSKVAIDQLVFYPRPILLPLLRCPGCLMLGHSINTCRSSVRCARCSGPHPSRKGDKDEVCGKPFHCFQCRGSHGPWSLHCPHILHAQQLYTRLASEGKPLPEINKQLRALQFPRPQRRTPTTAIPSPTIPTRSAARVVEPGCSFASVATGNRYAALQDLPIEAANVAQEEDTMLTPHIPTPPATHVAHHRRKPGRRSGVQPPPPTPIPDAEPGLLPVTVEAEVHHPPRNARHPQTPHHHPRQAPGQYSSLPPPSRPSSPPQDSTIPTATVSTSPLYLSSSPASSTSFGMATTSTRKECLSRTLSPPSGPLSPQS